MISSIWMIVRRSLRQHALSTSITVLAAALACGLVMSVFVMANQARLAFAGQHMDFDAVLGARGSQTQLVLNTIFHLETSPGNIPYTMYKTVKENRLVKRAIPYAVGDNYRGFRIVGTTSEIFAEDSGFGFRIAGKGIPFNDDKTHAVIGSEVARTEGLKLGDMFHPYHGLNFNEQLKHSEQYFVVGILEPTNSPNDRAIWIPLEGIWRMGGHFNNAQGAMVEAQPGVPLDDADLEVSAVLLKFHSPISGKMLGDQINQQGDVATLAWPIATVVAQLFHKLGWMHQVLKIVAYLVVVVAGGGLLASVYNTMNERRREFAILRALGARRSTVFSTILLESSTIAGLGAILGFAIYALIMGVGAYYVRESVGVHLTVFEFDPIMYWAPLGMLVVGAIAGILPACNAYGTDVADTLSRTS
tara:strand:+ start:8127 stop:9377 length:1251 start_codon:yes stop_codon:yes gene_type:complete